MSECFLPLIFAWLAYSTILRWRRGRRSLKSSKARLLVGQPRQLREVYMFSLYKSPWNISWRYMESYWLLQMDINPWVHTAGFFLSSSVRALSKSASENTHTNTLTAHGALSLWHAPLASAAPVLFLLCNSATCLFGGVKHTAISETRRSQLMKANRSWKQEQRLEVHWHKTLR